MQYSLNLEYYRDSFPVPTAIVNQHLKLAGALQIKVLLWMCCNKGYCENIETIATELGATPSDVQDALQYWICNDIICSADKLPFTTNPQIQNTQTEEMITPPLAIPCTTKTMPKPNRKEVAQRSLESKEVSWLMEEAQQKFNRTLSFAESSTLIWLLDTYGLSPAIIIMVIQYAVSKNKCNIKFIQTTAIEWATNEIDTVEKAEQYLTKLEQAQTNWYLVSRIFGIDKRKPTKAEETYVDRWLNKWNFTSKMIKCAYDSSVNNTGKISFAYINKVLQNWYESGITSPEDIHNDIVSKNKTAKSIKTVSKNKSKSYNIEELEKLI